jgi:type VI secretion system lysozyme-like protein
MRLLKRLATWQQGKQGSSNHVPLQDEILLDVENLLNSQQGNVLIDNNMGLKNLQGHFQSHNTPDLEGLGNEISAQIVEFEPRLKNVRVSLDEDNQDFSTFSWRLSATCDGDFSNINLAAFIKINANGRVSIASAM